MLNFMLVILFNAQLQAERFKIKISSVTETVPSQGCMLPREEKKSASALSEFFGGLVVVEIDRHSQIFFPPINNYKFWMAAGKATGDFISSC